MAYDHADWHYGGDYADMAMAEFFECWGYDEDGITKLDYDLQTSFLFPNLPPTERSMLSRLALAADELSEILAQDLAGMDSENRRKIERHKGRLEAQWRELKDYVTGSGLFDMLTPVQRAIVERRLCDQRASDVGMRATP